MRKQKRLNEVYMKEVIKSTIKTIKDEELKAYITFKHIDKTSKKCEIYINGSKVALADNNYTILEYSPINELYNVRIFIDDKNNILLYYFDVISKSFFKDNEIYYEDMFLDVLYVTKNASKVCNYILLDDESELIEAHNKKEITDEEFKKCYEIAEKIMNELKNNNNIFVNRGLKDINRFK